MGTHTGPTSHWVEDCSMGGTLTGPTSHWVEDCSMGGHSLDQHHTGSASQSVFHLGEGGQGNSWPTLEPSPPHLEIVLLKFIIDVDKCLTKCLSSESVHM